MKVYGRDLTIKLGDLVPSFPGVSELEDPCLVIWHGAVSETVVQILEGAASRWVLCVGTGALPEEPDAPVSGRQVKFPGRLRGLTWGLDSRTRDATGEYRKPEDVHPQWKLDCIKRFVAASEEVPGPPPWSLLDPPRVPEHVLASYLCALSAIPVPEEWQTGFEAEVSYCLGGEGGGQGGVLALGWKDRNDAATLRAFLMGSQAILEHPSSETDNEPG
jgi:hypothetical protein